MARRRSSLENSQASQRQKQPLQPAAAGRMSQARSEVFYGPFFPFPGMFIQVFREIFLVGNFFPRSLIIHPKIGATCKEAAPILNFLFKSYRLSKNCSDQI